jgi:hypothetical protein
MYESRTWEHSQDLSAKIRAEKNAKEYREKYLDLRAQMRKLVKEYNITPTVEIAKLLGIK